MNAILPCLVIAGLLAVPAAAQPRRPVPNPQAAKVAQLQAIAVKLQQLNNALAQQKKAQQQAAAAAQKKAQQQALLKLLVASAPKKPAPSFANLLMPKPAGITGKQGVQLSFNAMGLWGGMTPKTNSSLGNLIQSIPDSAWAKDPGQIAVNRMVDKMLGGR